MLILNEEKYAENLYLGKNNDIKSIVAKIGYVTRYMLYMLKCNDEDNYKDTVKWATKHHNNFSESNYSNLISDAIKRAHKSPFYKIDNIKITQSELDKISSLNDLRAEKVLFVLLCMAKQQSISNGFTNGLVKYSLPDLCKMARISVPTEEREYILYNIIQAGLLGYPKKNNTQCLIVNFIDNDGDAVLNLNENMCYELAYEYLNWKNNGNGYSHCEFCGRAIRQSKSNPKRFCKECVDMIGDVPDGMKVVLCVDCGNFVCVSPFDSETCRCEECYKEYRRKYKAEKEKERRERLKNSVDSASKNVTIQN